MTENLALLPKVVPYNYDDLVLFGKGDLIDENRV